MNKDPLVSCICLTHERPGSDEFLKRSVECFESQAYRNKQLIIVCDDSEFAKHMTWLRRGYIVLPVKDGATVGEKRNRGNTAAFGEVICHWDDDDYQSPYRVSHQVWWMNFTGKPVVGYNPVMARETREVYFIEGGSRRLASEWWLLSEASGVPCGASLCYAREYWLQHQFQNIQVGEDNAFCRQAVSDGDTCAVAGGSYMYVTNHKANVSQRMVVPGAGWTEIACGGVIYNHTPYLVGE